MKFIITALTGATKHLYIHYTREPQRSVLPIFTPIDLQFRPGEIKHVHFHISCRLLRTRANWFMKRTIAEWFWMIGNYSPELPIQFVSGITPISSVNCGEIHGYFHNLSNESVLVPRGSSIAQLISPRGLVARVELERYNPRAKTLWPRKGLPFYSGLPRHPVFVHSVHN